MASETLTVQPGLERAIAASRDVFRAISGLFKIVHIGLIDRRQRAELCGRVETCHASDTSFLDLNFRENG